MISLPWLDPGFPVHSLQVSGIVLDEAHCKQPGTLHPGPLCIHFVTNLAKNFRLNIDNQITTWRLGLLFNRLLDDFNQNIGTDLEVSEPTEKPDDTISPSKCLSMYHL